MPHIQSTSSRAATALLAILIAGVALAACGGASNGSSSTGASTSASTTATRGPRGADSAGFLALRECLRKNGVTLPKRTPGQRRSHGAGGFLGGAGGAPRLPKGVTRSQYEATIKKCGSFPHIHFYRAGGVHSPAAKHALARFASCMRRAGESLPHPNTSGKGPVFDTKGLDTTSAKFKAADVKCRSELSGAFRARPGAGGAPPG
jgi:hypothetical protein